LLFQRYLIWKETLREASGLRKEDRPKAKAVPL